MHLIQWFACVISCITFVIFTEGKLVLNDRPIIGILSQELSPVLQRIYPHNYTSFIPASYVKYVEGSGGRVVPIWINKDREYYDKIVRSVNGILLPGGAIQFDYPHGYAEAGDILFQLASESNDNGDYFPLWGSCFGFELMMYVTAGHTDIRSDCNSLSQELPLEFKPKYFNSRLFRNAPDKIIEVMSSKPVTAHFHQFCITEQNMTEYSLNRHWKVLSLNHDENGMEFVSAVESRQYPFYAVIFHPEKNVYEFKKGKKYPHSAEAVQVSQYFANFFVNEARKSNHSFANESEERASLIYNFNPTYTGDRLAFEQCYFFKE